MFGSCLNRNDYLHKPKMFDNADSWLDRLKRITDYEINKWNSYEETKQDKISVDTSKLTFNNNVLSVKDSFFNSIVETRLANFSSSFFNGAVAELQADIAQEILRLEGRLINDDSFNEYIDSKFIGYEKGNVLRQYITQYVTGYTYSTQEINNQLSYKQGQLSWGKGVKVNNDMEVSVNIDNEFSITRYLDIDRFVHINPAGDSDLVDGWDYAKEIDWQQLYHENKETQAFTVKNLLRIDYDEDTKVYTLGVPYTNRLVDADYAITSRTILRELRSEYEKKLFCLGNSIQLVNVDWFIHKFKETYEGYSTLTNDEVRTAYFGRNPEYPQLKTDFDAWYEIEYGPTAVDRITDLMCDCYQRAIIVNSSGTLDKYADGSALGENYWRTTLSDQTHLKYLYTTDGTSYFTPDEYSTSSTFEVKQKIVELHNRIDSLDVTEVGGTNKYISAISETDGKISATAGNIDTTVTANSDNLITSGAVSTKLEDYVTLATDQTITGTKTVNAINFTYGTIRKGNGLTALEWYSGTANYRYFVPADDNLYSLGYSTRRYNTVYTNNICNGTVAGNVTISVGDIVTKSDKVFSNHFNLSISATNLSVSTYGVIQGSSKGITDSTAFWNLLKDNGYIGSSNNLIVKGTITNSSDTYKIVGINRSSNDNDSSVNIVYYNSSTQTNETQNISKSVFISNTTILEATIMYLDELKTLVANCTDFSDFKTAISEL